MTRFARAKGSKADNERRPMEATAWSEVKRQLNIPGTAAQEQQEGNKKKRLHFNPEDEDDDFGAATTANDSDNADAHSGDEAVEEEEEGEPSDPQPSESDSDSGVGGMPGPVQLAEQEEEDAPKKKKKFMRSGKCLNCKEKGHLKMECPKLTEERRKELQDLFKMKTERKGKGTGRKKTGKKRKLDENQEHDGEDDGDNRPGKYVRVMTSTDNSGDAKANKEKNKDRAKSPRDRKKQKGSKEQKGPRDKSGKAPKKDKAGAEIGEGEGLFHGFRVRKEDVAVLRKLAKKLNESGMKREEIKETLKRERRRAEKALAREKKYVCFNCRQPGHELSECPEAASAGAKSRPATAQGKICFKCGSSEHTSRDCESRLKGADAFAFATCFICRETGHLAKACPDNPKGIYPKGGACGICGSVEHLKSACPRKKEKDDRGEVRVGTIGKGKRSMDEDVVPSDAAAVNAKGKKKTKTKKVVTF